MNDINKGPVGSNFLTGPFLYKRDKTSYNKRKNKWLSEHCERKYTPEYYELFNNLSPLAADARELVQIKIHKLLDTVKDANGFYDTSKLSEENQSKLKDLYLEKK